MPLFHKWRSGQKSLSPCCCTAICLLAHGRSVGIYTIVMLCLYLAKIQSVHASYFYPVAVRTVINHAPTARLFTGFFGVVDVEIQERQKFKRRRWKLEEMKIRERGVSLELVFRRAGRAGRPCVVVLTAVSNATVGESFT